MLNFEVRFEFYNIKLYYLRPWGLLYSDVAPSLFSEDIVPSSDDRDPPSEDVSEVWATTSPDVNSCVTTVSLHSLILPPWYSSASKNTSEPLTPEL